MQMSPPTSRAHGSHGSTGSQRKQSNAYPSLVYPPSPETASPRDEIPLMLLHGESFHSMQEEQSYFDKRRRGRQWEDRCEWGDRPSATSTPVVTVPPALSLTQPLNAPELHDVQYEETSTQPLLIPASPGSPDSIPVSPFSVPPPKLGIKKRPTFTRKIGSMQGIMAQAPSVNDPLVQQSRPVPRLTRKVAFEESTSKPMPIVQAALDRPQVQLTEHNPYFPEVVVSQPIEGPSTSGHFAPVMSVRRIKSLFTLPAAFKRKRTDSVGEADRTQRRNQAQTHLNGAKTPKGIASEADLRDAAKLFNVAHSGYVVDAMDRQRAISPTVERSNPFESLNSQIHSQSRLYPLQAQVPLRGPTRTDTFTLSSSLPSNVAETTTADQDRQHSRSTDSSNRIGESRARKLTRHALSRPSLPSLSISRPAFPRWHSRSNDDPDQPVLTPVPPPVLRSPASPAYPGQIGSPGERTNQPHPSFLTSEAHRISTPPLGRTRQGNVRGHFFDMNLADKSGSSGPLLSDSSRMFPMPRKTMLSLDELDDLRVDPDEVYDDRNWYRVRMDEGRQTGEGRSTGLEDEDRDGLPELRE